MTSKPAPGSPAWIAGRAAACEYQATYLVDRFSVSLDQARSFVERFGVERRELDRAVAELLRRRQPAATDYAQLITLIAHSGKRQPGKRPKRCSMVARQRHALQKAGRRRSSRGAGSQFWRRAEPPYQGLGDLCLWLQLSAAGRAAIARRACCFGERDGARTHDLLIKSQLLYRLSYALPRG